MPLPANPLRAIRSLILSALPELTDKKQVWVGDAEGDMPSPWIQIIGAGGPATPKQIPDRRRRIDVNCYADAAADADALSEKLNLWFEDYPGSQITDAASDTCIIAIDDETGPINLIDRDRRNQPLTTRSYILEYSEVR